VKKITKEEYESGKYTAQTTPTPGAAPTQTPMQTQTHTTPPANQ
jgi:hypothetical protein